MLYYSVLCHVGHYKALEWNEHEQKYMDNPELGILVEVDVCLGIPYVRCILNMNMSIHLLGT